MCKCLGIQITLPLRQLFKDLAVNEVMGWGLGERENIYMERRKG